MNMERLPLRDFVRYVLSGAVALFALALSYPTEARCLWDQLTGAQVAAVAAALPVVGLIIYHAHRALLHPVMLRLVVIFYWKALRRQRMETRDMFWPFWPTALEMGLIRLRWAGIVAPEPADRWASQVHALYCSAWAIGAVGLLTPIYPGNPNPPQWLPWAAALLLLGAVLEDVRLLHCFVVVEIEPAARRAPAPPTA
jgi:hypothetical protein